MTANTTPTATPPIATPWTPPAPAPASPTPKSNKKWFIAAGVAVVVFGAGLAAGSSAPNDDTASVPTTVSAAPEPTLPPATAAPVAVAPVVVPVTDAPAAALDDPRALSDRRLSSDEYDLMIILLANEGILMDTRAKTEEVGAAICEVAASTTTSDEFYSLMYTLAAGADEVYTVNDWALIIGSMVPLMCNDEGVRLGIIK